jgi:hypothetical protein
VTGKKDHLDSEISVSAEITETGLNASAKSRALVAFDRLIGSALDVPAAKLETVASKIRTMAGINNALIKSEGEAAQRKLTQHVDLGDRVIEGFFKEYAKKQLNRDAVVEEVIEVLKLPKPEDKVEVKGAIDEDWLNSYEKYASEASSERFRKLWAQVLAGEIRKPGKFSLATLRFMSELDAQIAKVFEAAIQVRSHGGYIIKPDKIEGLELLDFKFLQEIGLLHDGDLGIELEPKNGKPMLIQERDYGLLITPKNTDKPIHLKIVRITRIGQEISTILPPSDSQIFLRQVAKKIEEKAVSIDLVKIVTTHGEAKSQFLEKLL